MTKHSPFKYFKTSPEIIRLAVMLYVRFPLPLRNVEDLLHERGIDICHETVRYWWLRFGPMFAAEIKKRRIQGLKSSPHQAEPHRRSHRVARSLRGIRASVTVLAETGSNSSGSTPNDPTVLWAIARQRQKPSSRWTKGQSCTTNQIGPLKWD